MTITRLMAFCLVARLIAGSATLHAVEPTLAEERAFRAAVAHVAGAVVRVEPLALTATRDADAPEAAPGSGASTATVIGPGLVITTAFAVPADVDEAVIVLPDGGRRAGRVKARDRSRGLVLMAVEGLPASPPLETAPRKTVRSGQWAIALGRGWSATAPNVSVGIVSATNRAWGRGVQTDAAISPVNYGGPLVDIAGRVIGILAPLPADTAGMTEGTELYDAGIGFAVPLEDILAVLPRLASGESLDSGILGVSYRSRDQINGEPEIAAVRQGSPAARGGIAPGDRIVSIDGKPITRIADARHATGSKRSGDTVTVTVERPGVEGKVERVEAKATLVAGMPPWKRAIIGVVTAVAKDERELDPPRVSWVLPGSPAERAGVMAGDTIERIAVRGAEFMAVEGRASAAGILASAEPGDRIKVSIRRDAVVKEFEIDTVAMPVEVPAEGPPAERAGGDPLAGPLDAVEVTKLAGADVADPAIAVIPRGTGPIGVLIWAGLPRGKATVPQASPWKAAAARHGIAVVIVGSANPAAWSRDDVAAVTRALAALHAKRPIDTTRVGVAGTGAGAAFAWMIAERLRGALGGVALVRTALPKRAEVVPAEPGGSWWVLLGPSDDDAVAKRISTDQKQLMTAGYPTGLLTGVAAEEPPADLLCRWVSMLGLL